MKICQISSSRRSHHILSLSSAGIVRSFVQHRPSTSTRLFASLHQQKHHIPNTQNCRTFLWNSAFTAFTSGCLRGMSAMAKPTGIDQLTGLVNGLSLDSIAEKYPQAHPEINPLDFYRAHVSNVLAGISGVDSSIIFPAINWTTGLDKGDFVLAVPALRIKGQKPDALATKWAEEVQSSSLGHCMFQR